jgi:hypothetical protein
MTAQVESKARPARAPKAGKMAKDVQRQAAKPASTALADLESKTTTAAATASLDKAIRTGSSVNFSGQYLYDRFVNTASAEDLTKMALVRQMAASLDFGTFKANVGEMVKIAREQSERDTGTNMEAFSTARLKTAQNHQSVLRNVYGALRLLPDQLAEAGVDETTGYHVINTIAKRVLAEAKLKWDGSKLEDRAERDKRMATKQEAKALAEVMGNNPKRDDESRAEYLARIDGLVEAYEAKAKAETEAEQLAAMVAKIKEMAGANLPAVLAALSQ